MKLSYLLMGGFGFIIGWNIFLIQRDARLFESYKHPNYEALK